MDPEERNTFPTLTMTPNLQHPDAATAIRLLSEELPRVQLAMKELELAKTVSRETLDRMISV